MSKYIGETEKQLAQLFNAAEQGEIMLLFDEADSVFSKRTQVKSSNDRYANLEVNYLLQRMERFSGISILTSNFDNSIDEAFMRRIRFKVPFDIPDTKARLTLWNKFLSPAIPRANDVNLNFLADIYELSGGHIKEAVLRAASIAYASNNRVVTQELLIKSIHLEFKKLGKLLPSRGVKELLEESAHKAKKEAAKTSTKDTQ
jgi:SpoVK/Ycf46/Vps4 family AAA+-type ATPase